jgi:hypothetical protein
VRERLFIQQAIEVVGDHCQTVAYGYRFQSGDNMASWLLRWEYSREPPRPDYEYPLAHVHVNAQFAKPGSRSGSPGEAVLASAHPDCARSA